MVLGDVLGAREVEEVRARASSATRGPALAHEDGGGGGAERFEAHRALRVLLGDVETGRTGRLGGARARTSVLRGRPTSRRVAAAVFRRGRIARPRAVHPAPTLVWIRPRGLRRRLEEPHHRAPSSCALDPVARSNLRRDTTVVDLLRPTLGQPAKLAPWRSPSDTWPNTRVRTSCGQTSYGVIHRACPSARPHGDSTRATSRAPDLRLALALSRSASAFRGGPRVFLRREGDQGVRG